MLLYLFLLVGFYGSTVCLSVFPKLMTKTRKSPLTLILKLYSQFFQKTLLGEHWTKCSSTIFAISSHSNLGEVTNYCVSAYP